MSPVSLRPDFDLASIVRPNILALKPYRCARDDYQSGVLLDANENSYGPSLSSLEYDSLALNRYPDPHQILVKERLVSIRDVPSVDNIFVGVGSDEVIDLIIRIFCVPGKDKILVTPPSYGMYSVSAQVNDVGVVKVNLNVENGVFQLRTNDIAAAIEQNSEVKIIFLCSPGNPTGTALSHDDIRSVLENKNFKGIVVVDEAYVDFVASDRDGSVATWVKNYPNLLVSQTLSKSFGLAAIRLGIAFANPAIIRLMNNTKAPYNISSLTSHVALDALSPAGLAKMRENVSLILTERSKLIQKLQSFPVSGIGKILGANDANFLLVEFLNGDGKPDNKLAESVYKKLAEERGVVVRFRGNEVGCTGCLRITVGTQEENGKLLALLAEVLREEKENQ